MTDDEPAALLRTITAALSLIRPQQHSNPS
jgi:hypothetical protein